MSDLLTDHLGDPLPPGATQRLGTRRMQGLVVDMAYSADGELAIVTTGTCLTIWGLEQGELVATHEISEYDLTAMAVTKAVDRMAVSDQRGCLIEWDLCTHREICRIETGRAGGIATVSYSPDETHLLILDRKTSVAEEWDLSSGNRLQEISREGSSFNRAIYGPGGKTAFLGHQEGNNVYHYDLTTGELLKIFVEDYCNYDMCLSEDGVRLFVGTRHRANEWRLSDYACLETYTGHLGHAVPSVAYANDNDHLLTGSRDGSIRLWDRKQVELVRKWYPHQRHVNRMRVSPNGKWVMSYGGDQLLTESSLETGEGRLNWDRHRAGIHALSFTADGMRIISGSADKTVRIWHTDGWVSAGLLDSLKTEIHGLAVLEGDQYLAAGCKDGAIRIVSLENGEIAQTITAHRGYVRAVEGIAGDRILSAGGDGALRIWDWERGNLVQEMIGHQGGVLSLGLSADGTLAVSGGRDGTVRVWDMETGDPVAKIVAHRGWVQAVAFGGDNQTLVSAGRDGLVIEWDLEAESDIRAFDHGDWIEAIAITDTSIYSAGHDGLIAVWNRASGKRDGELKGHEGVVHTIAVDPEGRNLVSGSEDTTLLVWDIG
jgi:WD40 repeat protein